MKQFSTNNNKASGGSCSATAAALGMGGFAGAGANSASGLLASLGAVTSQQPPQPQGGFGSMTQLLNDIGGGGIGAMTMDNKTTPNSDINADDILNMLPGPGSDLIDNWDISSSGALLSTSGALSSSPLNAGNSNYVTSSQSAANALTLSPGGASASSSGIGFATSMTSPPVSWNNHSNMNMCNNVLPNAAAAHAQYMTMPGGGGASAGMMGTVAVSNGPVMMGRRTPTLRAAANNRAMMQQQQSMSASGFVSPTSGSIPMSPSSGYPSQRSPVRFAQPAGNPYATGAMSNRMAAHLPSLNRPPTPVSGGMMPPPLQQRSPIQSPSPQ